MEAVLNNMNSAVGNKTYITRMKNGKICIATKNKSNTVIKITLISLLVFTVIAFLTFDYKEINFAYAIKNTLANISTAFFHPKLSCGTFKSVLYQLFITFCLGILSTLIGAVLAFFGAIFCAKNISNPIVANVIKSIAALIRAVPTILWVLIFAISAGLGGIAAVIGLSFHSVSYLIKAYSESIEEMDYGTIEALKASGANFWQIVFQAVLPASISYMIAWTFMRFEINFTNAVAMGAAAGAGGIGYNLFMAGGFYFDLRETGYLTLVIVFAVILLETVSTKIKAKVK